MTKTLRYGAESSIRIPTGCESRLAHCDVPRGSAIADVAIAVDWALAEPLGYPPLAKAALPGDRVVLALADGVPQVGTVLARTIRVLEDAGVALSDITIVTTQRAGAPGDDPLDGLPDAIRSAVVVVHHDPNHRESLSYLAASAAGDPIYVNHAIHDADLVITVGCLRHDDSLGYFGVHSTLFPAFSDAKSIKRFRAPQANEPAERTRLTKLAEEVGWLLGAQFTLQVVPGEDGGVLHLLAGETEAVFREGRRRFAEAWVCDVEQPANLVIAAIGGDAGQQTWDAFARALHAASSAVEENGAVAICCEISENVGPALQRLAGADDPQKAIRTIGRQKPIDAPVAAELVRAQQRGKVYLLSRLNDDLVEELGMVPIEPPQFERLATRYGSTILLPNAQYAMARPCDEIPGDPSIAPANRRT